MNIKANPRTLITNLSGNSVSQVTLVSGTITKVQPKFLCDNEWYALDLLGFTGHVPQADRINFETIKMEFLVNEPITDPEYFEFKFERFMQIILNAGLRHGDLTKPHVFVRENSPVVIDWAESRHVDDPRPDKRREGDRYWWHYTCKEILAEHGYTKE